MPTWPKPPWTSSQGPPSPRRALPQERMQEGHPRTWGARGTKAKEALNAGPQKPFPPHRQQLRAAPHPTACVLKRTQHSCICFHFPAQGLYGTAAWLPEQGPQAGRLPATERLGRQQGACSVPTPGPLRIPRLERRGVLPPAPTWPLRHSSQRPRPCSQHLCPEPGREDQGGWGVDADAAPPPGTSVGTWHSPLLPLEPSGQAQRPVPCRLPPSPAPMANRPLRGAEGQGPASQLPLPHLLSVPPNPGFPWLGTGAQGPQPCRSRVTPPCGRLRPGLSHHQ